MEKLESLSIVIPAYNCALTLPIALKRAYVIGKKAAKKLEIVVVDDASVDQTPQLLKKFTKTIPVLRVITHSSNKGYGITIGELYKQAKHEWIFSLPGDYQIDAGELFKLLPMTDRADMILGWRNHRNDPKERLFQSKVYNMLLNLLFGISLHDVNTVRLMRKTLVDQVKLDSSSAFVDAELAIRAKRHGFQIREVPIAHRSRKDDGATGGKFFKTILPTIVDMIRMALF